MLLLSTNSFTTTTSVPSVALIVAVVAVVRVPTGVTDDRDVTDISCRSSRASRPGRNLRWIGLGLAALVWLPNQRDTVRATTLFMTNLQVKLGTAPMPIALFSPPDSGQLSTCDKNN